MSTAEKIKSEDKFVSVDGLKLRYIEEGSGPSVLFLHGASLGSSADVFLRNLGAFAKAGFRAVAFDYPGFGLSDVPEKQSTAQQRNSIPKFIDAAGLVVAPGFIETEAALRSVKSEARRTGLSEDHVTRDLLRNRQRTFDNLPALQRSKPELIGHQNG